jgi:hypothetical protein
MPVKNKIDIIDDMSNNKIALKDLRILIGYQNLDIMNSITNTKGKVKAGEIFLGIKMMKDLKDQLNERNENFGMDPSDYITNLDITSSISGSYDTCTINLKMSFDAYRRLFGDGLNQIKTGHMICVQRPTYYTSNKHEASMKPDLTIEPKININHDNEKISDQYQFEQLASQIDDLERSRIKTLEELQALSKDNGNDNPTLGLNVVVDQSNETIKKIIKKSRDIDKKFADISKNDPYDPKKRLDYTAMFFGFIDSINYNFTNNLDGLQITNLTIKCDSFIKPFISTEFLYHLPKLEYKYSNVEADTQPEVVYPDPTNKIPFPVALPKEYDLDYLNNWVKDHETWTAFLTDFLTDVNLGLNDSTEKKKSVVVNTRNLIRKIIKTFGQTLLPLNFQPSINMTAKTYGKNSENIITDDVTGKPLNPNGWLKLGMVINVITDQEHLPKSSKYRQFLPVHSATATAYRNGFRNAFNDKTVMVPWNIIMGTFVPDQTLFDCFPILIPLDNYSELDLRKQIEIQAGAIFKEEKVNKFKGESDIYPEFNPKIDAQLIYDFYREIGGIPCIVYRYKLLDPDFSINEANYKRLIAEHYIAQVQYGPEGFDNTKVKGIPKKDPALLREQQKRAFSNPRLFEQLQTIFRDHDFASPKINLMKDGSFVIDEKNIGLKMNQDACKSDQIPYIDFKDILTFDQTYEEDNRINVVWCCPPNMSLADGRAFETKEKESAIVNWYDIILNGIKMLKMEYPFHDDIALSTPTYLKAIAERLYSIYSEQNKRSRGTIVCKMQIATDILKGSWLRVRMNPSNRLIDEDTFKNDFQTYYQKYFDFYCYVDTIKRSYYVDENGNLICNTIIDFSRGKHGLIPTTFPEIITELTKKPVEVPNTPSGAIEKANVETNADIARQMAEQDARDKQKVDEDMKNSTPIFQQWLNSGLELVEDYKKVLFTNGQSNQKKQKQKNKIKKKK